MDISRDQILARLGDRLTELKVTENEASTRAGLERTFLSQLRRSPARWPRVDNLQRICDALGLRLTKLACVWPVEPEGLKAFAAGFCWLSNWPSGR